MSFAEGGRVVGLISLLLSSLLPSHIWQHVHSNVNLIETDVWHLHTEHVHLVASKIILHSVCVCVCVCVCVV